MKNHIPAIFGFAVLTACLLFGQPVLAAEAPPEDGVGIGEGAAVAVVAEEPPPAVSDLAPAPVAPPAQPDPEPVAPPADGPAPQPAPPAAEPPAQPGIPGDAAALPVEEPGEEAPEAPAPQAPPEEPALPDDTSATAVAAALNALPQTGAPVAAPAPQPPGEEPDNDTAPEPTVKAVAVPVSGGEVFEDGHWRYKDASGHYLTGFVRLPDGRIVYYDADGHMVFGSVIINGLPYSFNGPSYGYPADGRLSMTQGEAELDDGSIVYFDNETTEYLKNCFRQLLDGRVVYYGNDGRRAHGETIINGMPYYFDAVSGHLTTRTGEIYLPGRGWAYFNRDTLSYVKGFQPLADGRTVYYGDDYTLRFGQQTIADMPYSFDNSNGNILLQSGEVYVPGKGWAYFNRDTGEYAKGFRQLADGRTVYYGPDGAMLFGTQTIGDMPYSFDNGNGNLLLQSGEVHLPGRGWAYFNRDTGEYAKGFRQLADGRTVYYGPDGAMRFGEQSIGNMPYHFDTGNGQLLNTGEAYLAGKGWAYLNPATAQYATGMTKLPDGRFVYYGSDHTMLFGTQTIDDMDYTFNPSNGELLTKPGEQLLPGKGWAYLNPATGLFSKGFTALPDGRTVYYGDDYVMRFGEQNIGGNWFYLNPSNGSRATGFTRLPDGRQVYYSPTGGMHFGILHLGADTYYMEPTSGNMYKGYLNTGWRNGFGDLTEGVYHFMEDGRAYKGWNQWFAHEPLFNYYLPDGKLAHGWQNIDGSRYYFCYDYYWSSSGNMHRGWLIDGDDWYYLQENGKMAAGGWVEVKDDAPGFGRFVLFDDSGRAIDSHTPWPRYPHPHHQNGSQCVVDSIIPDVGMWPTCRAEGDAIVECPGCWMVGHIPEAALDHEYVYRWNYVGEENKLIDGQHWHIAGEVNIGYFCRWCFEPMPY